MNPTIQNAIATGWTAASVGAIVDGGEQDALSTIGENSDGYVTLGGVHYAIGDRFIMAASAKTTFDNYAAYVDVSTVSGYASVTAIEMAPVSSTDATEGLSQLPTVFTDQ